MPTMPDHAVAVILGVDTHEREHVAALIDELGRLLETRSFVANAGGYRQLLAWAREHGPVIRAGVEGTGSFGAGLARFLAEQGVAVVEVTRPSRRGRRHLGKSDTIDAEAAARTVLSGEATATPKRRDGIVEAIRVLQIARRRDQGAHPGRTADPQPDRHRPHRPPQRARTPNRQATGRVLRPPPLLEQRKRCGRINAARVAQPRPPLATTRPGGPRTRA